MFKSLAEIILRSKIARENLNRRKQFLSWDQIKTIALILNHEDKINKSALDKFVDGTGKLISVFYVETGSKTPTYSDWLCFSGKESSFLGLPRKIVQQNLKSKQFDLAINTSPESDIFASGLITALPATFKCGSGKKNKELDLIIQKSDPYHVIDYLNEVIKYLKNDQAVGQNYFLVKALLITFSDELIFLKTYMDLEFNKNDDTMRLLIGQMEQRLQNIYLGGGIDRIEKLHAQGKMSARERTAFLLDKDTPRFEMGAFAGYEMYEEHGGCPGGGVVITIGYVSGRQCIVVANDATVKAGAWFPITGKKNLRAQEIAMENRLPIIYLVDSAGVYLPLQDEIFPDKEHFGRIFRNNAVMSSMGILQVAAVMGSCVAGGAYLPIMSDEAMIVDKTGSIFLAGSYLVKAAIGEKIDNETLGGATTHCEISGVTDYKCKDDADCLKRIRNIMSKVGDYDKAGFDRIEINPPKKDPKDIYGIVPDLRDKQYSMYEIIERLVDNSQHDEYKEHYGKSIICTYARIEGWAVGIVANQRVVVKGKKPGGTNEMQFGGVIYSDSADKAARFIMNCNQKKIPLVFIQDATGFMVGSRSEQGGIIKDGAKLVNAMANSVVPKFTIIVGNSYGAANYAMCGKAYDPRLIVGWPTAKIAVMGGTQAARVLVQIEVASLKAKGEEITPEKEAELFDKIKARYDKQTTPYYAAARLWMDAIIDPLETRKVISMGIEMANHAPITKQYNVGILQT